MFKVLASTDELSPAELSFLSVAPNEHECVYPPGVYLELGKVFTEYEQVDNKHVQYKTAEVVPMLGRNLSATKSSKVQAAA